MFEAKMSEALTLKKIIEAIKDLVTDVNIDATPSGISLQAMDSSHVALVSLTLGSMGFKEYRADRAMTLGISVTNLAKVLKLASNEDEITLRAEEEGSHLQITFENRRQEKRTEFQLNLITLDSEHLGIPETQYSSEVTMNAQDFQKLCKELHQLSETVQIEASIQSIKFNVEGEVGSGSVQIMTSGEDAQRASAMAASQKKDGGAGFEKVNLSFALRYLNMFNKASTLCSNVKLMLASDTPLVVEYEIESLGSLKYYLAPKINENE